MGVSPTSVASPLVHWLVKYLRGALKKVEPLMVQLCWRFCKGCLMKNQSNILYTWIGNCWNLCGMAFNIPQVAIGSTLVYSWTKVRAWRTMPCTQFIRMSYLWLYVPYWFKLVSQWKPSIEISPFAIIKGWYGSKITVRVSFFFGNL